MKSKFDDVKVVVHALKMYDNASYPARQSSAPVYSGTLKGERNTVINQILFKKQSKRIAIA